MAHRILSEVSVIIVITLLLAACGGNNGGGGGGQQPPATPTGVSATPGNQQVSLNWNASSGATSYHVKRSTTSGGPYTQVASQSTTSYTDTSVTNGTTYYYVVSAANSAGESGNSTEVSAKPTLPPPPSPPTGVTATPGNAQVSLSWNASSGATTYHVKRSGVSGGPYTQVGAPTATNYTDTTVTNGTPYYYVVTALNVGGESGNSSEVSATPNFPTTAVNVSIDVLSNRHVIGPYVYGGSYPKDANTIADSGLSVVRWGGNATSRYNWKLKTYNAANDWYFEDFNISGLNDGSDGDSTVFIQDVKNHGSNALMTMVMLDWVAMSAETSSNKHWSFSVAKYGAQCGVDPYNSDAGNGVVGASCNTYLTADPNDANVPLLDQPGSGDPPGSVYRNQWAAALATAFNTAGTPHFYDMDNETDIWGGTHRDVHPSPAAYDELRDTYLRVANNLKTWDPAAIRLGPVGCCWWFYWNGANSNDKGAHAGIDLVPWWLNEVYWRDQIAGARSLDVFDIHAYPDGPDTSSFTQAQKQALAVRIYRDYWDPTHVSESNTINQTYTTQIQPLKTIAFRIPRMRALVNATYPGTPLSITEWSAEFAGAADFSTALGDADAYGIIGRERVYLASRWTAPDPANPNYQALKLYTNYDGQHHMFAPISVANTNNGDPNLFSSYAAVNAPGTLATVMVLNKDPQNAAQVTFAFNGFTPSQVTTYTLSQASPNSIVASGPTPWTNTQTFNPYTATLLVITGTSTTNPSAEWDLNPDTIMVPAGGTTTLNPIIVSGSGSVNLTTTQSDSGITVAIGNGHVTTTQNATINVTAGNTPGFYHYTVSGADSTATQTQGGWIVVGNLPATMTPSGQSGGPAGSQVTLTVTLVPGQSGGTAAGADILFTTDAGSLSSRIVTTDASGNASVTLTLPGTPGPVHVTAEGPIPLGHPVVTFTETAQ